MHDKNKIHPTAYIEDSVSIGSDNVIGPYAVIVGNVTIGNGNWIGAHTTIGSPAQFSTEKFELNGEPASGIRIGNWNVFREYCSVHQPSRFQTVVENECYLMAYVNVSHDTTVRERVILSSNVQMGGFVEIGAGANLGLSAILHQFTTVGAYAMVGMGAVLNRDIAPFVKCAGNPVRFLGVNTIGLKRNGFTDDEITEVGEWLTSGKRASSARIELIINRFSERSAETHRPTMPCTERRKAIVNNG